VLPRDDEELVAVQLNHIDCHGVNEGGFVFFEVLFQGVAALVWRVVEVYDLPRWKQDFW